MDWKDFHVTGVEGGHRESFKAMSWGRGGLHLGWTMTIKSAFEIAVKSCGIPKNFTVLKMSGYWEARVVSRKSCSYQSIGNELGLVGKCLGLKVKGWGSFHDIEEEDEE